MPLASCSPFSAVGMPPLVQSVFQTLTEDVTTTSTSFVEILRIDTPTYGGTCLVSFSVSGNATSNRNVYFAAMLDGVLVRGTKFRQDGGSGAPASLVCHVAPDAGDHTFQILWAVSSGTGRIRAATITEEHASLLIEEITR